MGEESLNKLHCCQLSGATDGFLGSTALVKCKLLTSDSSLVLHATLQARDWIPLLGWVGARTHTLCGNYPLRGRFVQPCQSPCCCGYAALYTHANSSSYRKYVHVSRGILPVSCLSQEELAHMCMHMHPCGGQILTCVNCHGSAEVSGAMTAFSVGVSNRCV